MRAWAAVMCWMVVPGLAGARWEPGDEVVPEVRPMLTLQAAPWVVRGERLVVSLGGTVAPGKAHLLASDAAGVVHAPSSAFGGPMPELRAPMKHVGSAPFAGTATWSMVVDGYAPGGQVAFQVVHAAGQERVMSNALVVRVLEREGDEDGDGVTNLAEVQQGLDPLGPGALSAQVAGSVTPAAGPALQAPQAAPAPQADPPRSKARRVTAGPRETADSGRR